MRAIAHKLDTGNDYGPEDASASFTFIVLSSELLFRTFRDSEFAISARDCDMEKLFPRRFAEFVADYFQLSEECQEDRDMFDLEFGRGDQVCIVPKQEYGVRKLVAFVLVRPFAEYYSPYEHDWTRQEMLYRDVEAVLTRDFLVAWMVRQTGILGEVNL